MKFYCDLNRLQENRTNIKELEKKDFSHSKSRGAWLRVGSIPTAGTNFFN